MKFINPSKKLYHYELISEFSDISRFIASGSTKGFVDKRYPWFADFSGKFNNNYSFNPHIASISFFSDYDIFLSEYANIPEIVENYPIVLEADDQILSGHSHELSTKQYSKISYKDHAFDVIEFINQSEIITDIGDVTRFHQFYYAPVVYEIGYKKTSGGYDTYFWADRYKSPLTIIDYGFNIVLADMWSDYVGQIMQDLVGSAERIIDYKVIPTETNWSFIEEKTSHVFYPYDLIESTGYTNRPHIGFPLYYKELKEIDFQNLSLPQITFRNVLERQKLISTFEESETGRVCFHSRGLSEETDDQSQIIYDISRWCVYDAGTADYRIGQKLADGTTLVGVDVDVERNRRYSAVVTTEPYMAVKPINNGEVVDYKFVDDSGNDISAEDFPDKIKFLCLKIKASGPFIKNLDRELDKREMNTDILHVAHIKNPIGKISSNLATDYGVFGPTNSDFFSRQEYAVDDLVGGVVGIGKKKLFRINSPSWITSQYTSAKANVCGIGYYAKSDFNNATEEYVKLYCNNYIPDTYDEYVFTCSDFEKIEEGEVFRPMIKIPGMKGYVKIIERSIAYSPVVYGDGSEEVIYNIEFPYCPGSYKERTICASEYKKSQIFYKDSYISAGNNEIDSEGHCNSYNARYAPSGDKAFSRVEMFQSMDGHPPIITLYPGDDIQSFVDANPEGTSFYLKAGVYREQKIIPKNNNAFIGEDGAILNGSRVLVPEIFSTLWNIPEPVITPGLKNGIGQCDNTAQEYPEILSVYNSVAETTTILKRVDSSVSMNPYEWYLDYENQHVYVYEDYTDTRYTVELSVTKYAFGYGVISGKEGLYTPERVAGTLLPDSTRKMPNIYDDMYSYKPKDVIINNLIIEKYANPAQTGAIGYFRPGLDWVIVDNEVRYCHGAGIKFKGAAIVKGNNVHNNGQIGIVCGDGNTLQENGGELEEWGWYGGYAGSGAVVKNNEIAYNRLEAVGIIPGWEGGGTKFAQVFNLDVDNNYVHHNGGIGLWSDFAYDGVVYRNNLVDSNVREGIFIEISAPSTIITNNKVINNATYMSEENIYGGNIMSSNSSGVEISYNEVDVHADYGNGITLIEVPRNVEGIDVHCYDCNVHHNDIKMRGVGNSFNINGGQADPASSTDIFNLFYANIFENNSYHVLNVANNYWRWHKPPYDSYPPMLDWTEWRDDYDKDASGTIDYTLDGDPALSGYVEYIPPTSIDFPTLEPTLESDPEPLGGDIVDIKSRPVDRLIYPAHLVYKKTNHSFLALTKPSGSDIGTFEMKLEFFNRDLFFDNIGALSSDAKMAWCVDNRVWKFGNKFSSYINRECPSYVFGIDATELSGTLGRQQYKYAGIPDIKRWIYANVSAFCATIKESSEIGDYVDGTVDIPSMDSNSDVMIEIWDNAFVMPDSSVRQMWRPFSMSAYDTEKYRSNVIIDGLHCRTGIVNLYDNLRYTTLSKTVFNTLTGFEYGLSAKELSLVDGKSNLVLYDSRDDRTYHVAYIRNPPGESFLEIYFIMESPLVLSIDSSGLDPYNWVGPISICLPYSKLNKNTNFNFNSCEAMSEEIDGEWESIFKIKYLDFGDKSSETSDFTKYVGEDGKIYIRVRPMKTRDYPTSKGNYMQFIGSRSMAPDEFVNIPWYDGGYDSKFDWSKIDIIEQIRKFGLNYFSLKSK